MNKILKSILALVVGVFVSTGAIAGQAGDGVNRLADIAFQLAYLKMFLMHVKVDSLPNVKNYIHILF